MKRAAPKIWAVMPVKEIQGAKQRLSAGVPEGLREALVLTMLEDVLAAISQAKGLAGIAVVTLDPKATTLAQNYGARILTGNARGGHSGAVAAAARQLAEEGIDGILQLPGDIPLATADEFSRALLMHQPAPSFTIVPSHDEFGSNTIIVSPPTAVPLTFGDDSFFPHLKTAKSFEIEPVIVRLPGVGRDIDNPADLAEFARFRSRTRTQAFLDRHSFPHWKLSATKSC
ncbi:MAG: 2-phospho-L-lactate guanylyltransferase [Xanthobacteraceae bacterium]